MTALPKISVIIPCYKAENTLSRAVATILDGSPDNLQLLLVEDGSPDGTAPLCDRLAESDARITALHRKNGGAAAARNTGLAAATGDWVMFVDADDELLPGLWQALPIAFGADGGIGLILYGMIRQSGPAPCPLAPGLYRSLAEATDVLDPLLFESGYLASPYPKLFRRDLLEKYRIRFDETLQINEDVLFNIVFLQFSQNSSAIYSLPGVYYMQNDLLLSGLSRGLRGDLLRAEAMVRPALQKLLQGLPLPQAERDALLAESRLRACLNQYGVLTGRKGTMPFAVRRALFAEILADAQARSALQAQLRQDKNALLALPYRFGVACKLPGWLAFYTMIKNHFL